jgi:hypothetical protein
METNLGGGEFWEIFGVDLNLTIFFHRELLRMMPLLQSTPSKLAFSGVMRTRNSWLFAPPRMRPKLVPPQPTKCISAAAAMVTAML